MKISVLIKKFKLICYIIAFICSANIKIAYSQIENGFWSNQFYRQFGSISSPGEIYAIAIHPTTGAIYIGGKIDYASCGTTCSAQIGNIAKWDGSYWTNCVAGSGFWGTNDIVRALAFKGDTLFVGGDFTKAGNKEMNHIAKLSIVNSNWDSLHVNGGTYLLNGVDGPVYSIAVSPAGEVFFGGNFGWYSGSGAISTSTTLAGISSWINGAYGYYNTQFTYFPYSRYALACDPNTPNLLYVGGDFVGFMNSNPGPDPPPHNNIALLNTSSKSWGYLGTGVSGGVVNCIVTRGTDVYVGGSFTTAGGIPANYIAKWDGTSWSTLGTGLDGVVNAMAFDGSGILYVVGSFTNAGGVSAFRIAKWNGTSWSAMGSGLNSVGYAAASDGSNIYAGGIFRTAGAFTSNGFARYYPVPNNISGTVTYNSAPQSGTTVSLASPYATSVITDGLGGYSFNVGTFGTYTITPTKSGFEYNPTNLQVAGTAAPQSGLDFAALGTIRTISQTNNSLSGVVNTQLPPLTPFTVTVTEQSGIPVPNLPVTFVITTIPSGATGQSITYSSINTDVNGQASTTLTLGKKTGTYIVTATASTTNSPVTFTGTATADIATDISLTSGDGQNRVVGTALLSPFVVTVKDQYGNPVPSQSVTFAISSSPGGGTLGTTTTTTNSSGQASSILTLGTIAGTYSVTATSEGLTGSPITFTATAIAGSATNISLTSGNGQSGTVGTVLSSSFVVTVTDQYGNLAKNQSITFAIASTPAFATGQSINNTSVTIDVDGQASTTLTLGTKTGVYSVTATSGVATNTFTATATAGAATNISLTSGNGQSGTVTTALTNTFVVTVMDANSNVVSGQSVTFAIGTVPSGATGQSLTNTTITTNTSGQALTQLTLGTKSGTYTVTATSGSLTGSPVTFTATATAGPATNISLTSGNGQSGTVTTALTNTFVVTVKDANSNVVSGQSVTFAIASTPAGATGQSINNASVTTDVNGQASTKLTLGTKAGSYTVTATSPGLAGSPIAFTVTATAGAATSISYSSGNNQTGTVGSNLSAPFKVLVTDAYGNPIQNHSVSFTVKNSPIPPGATIATPVLTDASGIASATLTLGQYPGWYYVDVTSGLTGDPVPFTATAAAGAPSIMSIITGDGQTGNMMTKLTDSLIVKITDSYSNVLQGQSVTFTITTNPVSATGQSLNNSTTTYTATTDIFGNASTILKLGNVSGMYKVTASLNTLSSVFSDSAKTFNIEGYISYSTGKLSGVSVSCPGANTTPVLSGTDGSYSFTMSSMGNYTITPTKASYDFIQPSITLSNVYLDQTGEDFTAKGKYTITGTITHSGSPLQNIPVTLYGLANGSIPISKDTTTNSVGVYTFFYLPDADYTVDPYQPGYTFTPLSPPPVKVFGANTTQNFTAALNPYTLSGLIQDEQLSPLSGVTVNLGGGMTGSQTTIDPGLSGYNYQFTVIALSNYKITPEMIGYRFSPPEFTYTNLLENQLKLFNAYKVPEISVSSDSLKYGTIPINSTKPLGLKIKNPGLKPLIISELKLTNSNASEFKVEPVTFPITVIPEDSAILTINFTPISPDPKVADLEITHNAPSELTIVNLTGIGKSPMINYSTINIKCDSTGFLQPSIDSGIILRNQTDTTIVISSIYFETPDTIFQILQQLQSSNYQNNLKRQLNIGESAKLQQLPIYIYPYDSIKITVRFNSNTVGTFTNTLHIINDSYNSPHIQIPITGKTVGSNITSPLTTDLGTNELLSSPKDTTLNITNTGQYPLLINSLTIYPSTSPLEITNTFPGTGLLLNPGESYPVTLRLKTREPYHDSIQLIIQNNSSNNPFTAITIFGEVAKAKLSLSPTETDFGTTSIIIPQITKTIIAENLASQKLTITGKKITGDIESYKIRDDISPQQLEANGQSNIDIDFFPRSAGVKLCTLKVSYINPVNNVPSDLYIYMKGTSGGKPILETNIDQINLGEMKLNSYKDTLIAIKNAGNLNLNITSEAISGTDKNILTLLKSKVPLTLEMGQMDTVKIRMTSSLPLGDKSATLQIQSNDQSKTINITGFIKSPIEETDITKIIWSEHYTGTNNDTIVTIKNAGNDILQINNIITDGQTLNDFTLPELQLPISLMPQNESAIKVRFNPVIAGIRFARIIIMSNDPVNPELPIPLRGTGVQGTPKMELFTDTINFQPIPFGETTTGTFTIRNTGTDTLRISNIDLTGTNTENFGTTNVIYPIKIPINTERQIDLKFSPTVSGDNYAQLNIQSDDTTTIKKTIILHGICLGKSSIKISTDLIDYGIAEKGEIRDSIITISNQGTTGLKIDSLIIIGLNRADFKTENITLPFIINPSGTKQITIKYIPVSQISTRSDAKLQIYSDDVSTVVRGVTLKGLMTAVSITPKRLDFGKTSIDTPMTERKIFITNNSTGALTIKSGAISEDTLSFKLKTITRNVNLPPGKTDTITIGFYPRTTGTKTSILTIATSDTITPTFIVNNSGEGGGRPKLYSTAEKINFGILGLAITKDTNIIIRNDGNLDLQITGKNITGKDKDYFTIIEGSTPKILQSGQEETMKIRLTGRVPVGDKIAQLQIASNDNERNPMNIDLIGLTKSPVIALSVNKINLDTVSIGDTSKADFTIKNGGNDTLIINSISLEGDSLKNYFITGYQLPIKLQSNETKSITTGYSPKNYGASSVNIIINSNDVTVPNTKIEVNGMGKKSNVITASPLKIELTGVTIYRTKDTTIVITNEDINPRWIKTITMTGDNTQFEIPKIDSFKLAANETKNIVVKYKPTAEGTSKCKIEIIPLDTIRNQKITINITGTSIIPITKIQNTEINFPNVRVNTTRDTIITVENRGAGILEIREVLITGDTADYKAAVIQNPKEVQPGGKTEITISFIPKSSGDKNATITLRTNEPNNVMTNVKLKGKGIEPKLTISSTKIDMGKLFVIMKKDTTITITNNGTDILNIKKIYVGGNDSTRFTITGTSITFPGNIKPNESIKIAIQYQAKSVGKKEAEIRIESDDPATAIAKISITGEGTIPRIILDSDLIAEENQTKVINFHLSEQYSPLMIKIYYKHGNTNLYDSTLLQPSGNNTNSYTFGKELFTKNGFDFYIKYIWEGVEITLPDTNYKNSPLTYQILIKSYDNVVHFYPKSYAMVTVPLYFNNTNLVQEIISNLGPYNSSSWRIFRLSGEEYKEYTDGDNDGDENILLPGDGFWMITNENKGLTFHNSLTVPTNKEYRIRLQPGWNQIGSPFTFMIPVTGMKIPDNKRIDKTLWDWTVDGEYRIEDKYFEPWKGYFIRNNEVDSIDVFMSPISAAGLTKTEQTNSNTASTMKEGEWKYRVEIRNLENNSTTKQITDAIEFGCLTIGKEGWDKNDVGEPPISPKGTKTILGSIRFPHNDWNECKGNYIKDYRDLNNRGNTWELEIERSHPFFSNHQYELILNRTGDSPQYNEILIHDYDNINSKEYNEESILFQRIEHKFNFGLDKNKKKLRIVVGTKSYVSEMKEQISNEIKQQPITAYLLKQNYPNPFNPGTIIEYEIPKSELVKIIIYNTLGQEVQTLLNKYQETGRYSIEWNPKEKSGGLPSGIYFYKLQSGNFTQIKKMLYIR